MSIFLYCHCERTEVSVAIPKVIPIPALISNDAGRNKRLPRLGLATPRNDTKSNILFIKDNMLIREAQKDEYEKIAELVNEAYAIPFLPDTMTTKANDSAEKIVTDTAEGARILATYQEQKLLGTIRYRPIDNDSLYCYKLAVKPDHRKLGIGKSLIGEVLSIARILNFEEVVIEVAEAKGLVPYYESMGFIAQERNLMKDHYEVKMSKKIF